MTGLGVISRVRFLVSLIVKEGDNQIHKLEVEQVIYFSKYNVVLADVDNEFWSEQGIMHNPSTSIVTHIFIPLDGLLQSGGAIGEQTTLIGGSYDSWSPNKVSQSCERHFTI